MVVDRRTRGHSLKIVLPRCNLELKKRFFHIRVIQMWNALPEDVVTQASLSSFKPKLVVEIESILYPVLQFLGDHLLLLVSWAVSAVCFACSIGIICNVHCFWLFQLYMQLLLFSITSLHLHIVRVLIVFFLRIVLCFVLWLSTMRISSSCFSCVYAVVCYCRRTVAYHC